MQKNTSNIEILRVQSLSILCTPHPFHDFSGFSPLKDRIDPHCNTKQQSNNNVLFDVDGFVRIQDKIDQHFCSTKQQTNHDSFCGFDNSAPVQDKLDPYRSTKKQISDIDEENIEKEEFRFTCGEVQGMHIYADEIFENGKIRPLLHNFDQYVLLFPTPNNDGSLLRLPLKKIFLTKSINPLSISGGISKELQNVPLENMTMVEMSSECYEKNNSTRSSNLWKFRQNIHLRSNNNNKDSLVLMNPTVPKKSSKTKVDNIVVKKRKDEKPKVALSAYEKFYVTNKTKKDSNKRKTFLPYKHQLFSLFTNKNALSKNLHPF
ncbi:uncharacterized protein LOC123922974 [Trifolium pratense]|uniref:uncharacterized protein LOC123922974 n=1 Tax=Trifolium pratense TaxID=57577 RepID=UPI001E691C64|nr:uncharacterized protein LOC123922974 [Trifolium pratense]